MRRGALCGGARTTIRDFGERGRGGTDHQQRLGEGIDTRRKRIFLGFDKRVRMNFLFFFYIIPLLEEILIAQGINRDIFI